MKDLIFASAQARELYHLRAGLVANGYRVALVTSSAQVRQAVAERRVVGVVLNVASSSPTFDPWQLMSELRMLNHLALVVLTRAAPKQDRVRAFQSGALHCLTLPTSAVEL